MIGEYDPVRIDSTLQRQAEDEQVHEYSGGADDTEARQQVPVVPMSDEQEMAEPLHIGSHVPPISACVTVIWRGELPDKSRETNH